jgi:hypothetical protein
MSQTDIWVKGICSGIQCHTNAIYLTHGLSKVRTPGFKPRDYTLHLEYAGGVGVSTLIGIASVFGSLGILYWGNQNPRLQYGHQPDLFPIWGEPRCVSLPDILRQVCVISKTKSMATRGQPFHVCQKSNHSI